MVDNVNHPKHYISGKGIEVIDVIEAFTENLRGIQATDTGNIIKYICRWHEKNGVEDLEKARWYLNHLIEHEKAKSEKSPDGYSEKDFDCKHCLFNDLPECSGLSCTVGVRKYMLQKYGIEHLDEDPYFPTQYKTLKEVLEEHLAPYDSNAD